MLVTKLSAEGALKTSCNRCLDQDNAELNWLTAQMTQASVELDEETEKQVRSPSHAVRKAFARGICYGKTLAQRESVPGPSSPIPPTPPPLGAKWAGADLDSAQPPAEGPPPDSPPGPPGTGDDGTSDEARERARRDTDLEAMNTTPTDRDESWHYAKCATTFTARKTKLTTVWPPASFTNARRRTSRPDYLPSFKQSGRLTRYPPLLPRTNKR